MVMNKNPPKRNLTSGPFSRKKTRLFNLASCTHTTPASSRFAIAGTIYLKAFFMLKKCSLKTFYSGSAFSFLLLKTS
jgi:hypothetical protein